MLSNFPSSQMDGAQQTLNTRLYQFYCMMNNDLIVGKTTEHKKNHDIFKQCIELLKNSWVRILVNGNSKRISSEIYCPLLFSSCDLILKIVTI